MMISKAIRDELIRTVNHPDNPTNSSNIPIGKYINEKGEEYVFAYICQKKDKVLRTDKQVKLG